MDNLVVVVVVVVVDNDDFKSDTLTGDATAAHRTNVIIRPKDLEVKHNGSITQSIEQSSE